MSVVSGWNSALQLKSIEINGNQRKSKEMMDALGPVQFCTKTSPWLDNRLDHFLVWRRHDRIKQAWDQVGTNYTKA